MTLKFDCRTINNGGKCKYLVEKDSQKIVVPTFYTCSILNSVLLPEVENKGKITENMQGLSPLFHCPMMKEKRLNKQSMDVNFTIHPNGNTEYWNESE